MDMTNNMTKASLKTLLEDIGFEADNDEETIYKLAINIEKKHKDKNYSGPFDMLTITVYFDYKFPRNKFKSNKNKDNNNDNGYIRILCWFATYDYKLGKFTKTDTLYTKDSKEVVKFLEEYIGEITEKGASDSERQ